MSIGISIRLLAKMGTVALVLYCKLSDLSRNSMGNIQIISFHFCLGTNLGQFGHLE